MTFYTLVVGDEGREISDERREEILDWLERDESFRNELEDFHESGMSGHTKWEEHPVNEIGGAIRTDREDHTESGFFSGSLCVVQSA